MLFCHHGNTAQQFIINWVPLALIKFNVFCLVAMVMKHLMLSQLFRITNDQKRMTLTKRKITRTDNAHHRMMNVHSKDKTDMNFKGCHKLAFVTHT